MTPQGRVNWNEPTRTNIKGRVDWNIPSALSGAGSFVNAPFEEIGKKATAIQKKISPKAPLSQQVAEFAPQIAQGIGETLGGRVFKPAGPVGEFLGTGAGQIGSNLLKGATTLATKKPALEKAGDVVRAIGSLNPTKRLAEGVLGPAFTTVGKVGFEHRLPTKDELKESYKEGIDFASLLGPLSQATGFALHPILSKISPVEIKNINTYLNLAKNATSATARKQAVNLITKRIVQNLTAEGIKGGVPMALMSSMAEAKDTNERIKKTVEGFVTGAAFNVGIKSAGLGTQALKGQVIDPAIQRLKTMTPAEKQAGFISLGGSKPDLHPEIVEALNKKDYTKAQKIIDEMDPRDPYKESLTNLVQRLNSKPQTFTVYRGEGGKISEVVGFDSYGPGKYYSTDKEFAKNFGTVTKTDVTFKNPLVLKGQGDLDAAQLKALTDDPYNTLADWAAKQGYDGIVDKATGTVIELPKQLGKMPTNFTPIIPGGSIGGAAESTVGTAKSGKQMAPIPPQTPDQTKGKLKVGGGTYATAPFNVVDQVDDIIRENAKAIEPNIKYERRGVVSWENTMKDAQKIDIAKYLSRQRGGTADNAYIAASANYIKDSTTKIYELRNAIQQAKASGAHQVDINRLEVELQLQTALNVGIIQKALGARTEAGRALNAAKILAQQLQSPQERLKGKVIAENWKHMDVVIEHLMKFDPEDKEGMMNYLMQVKPTDSMNILESYWTNSILSGTSTFIKNTLGNTVRTIWHVATKPLRVGTDIVTSKITKEPREEFIREWGPEIHGTFEGLPNGIRKGLKAFNTGLSEENIQSLSLPPYHNFGNPTMPVMVSGKIRNLPNPISAFGFPTRGLLAMDEVGRSVNSTMEIYRQATKTAIKEGLTGEAFNQRVADLVTHPTPEIQTKAAALAKKLLFQDYSGEIEAAGKIRSFGATKLPFELGTIHPMRFVLPFIQIAVNVAKFGFEAGPAGMISTLMKGPGQLGREEFNRQMGSAVLGTTLLAGLAAMNQSGKLQLTGKPPTDPKAKDAFYAVGKQPYSFKIAGQWVPFQILGDPLATILSTVIAYRQSFIEDPIKATQDVPIKTAEFLLSYGGAILDRTFLTGISELMDAMQDPKRYARKFIANRLTGFIPFSSFQRSVANFRDRTVREPRSIEEQLDTSTAFPMQKDLVPARESEFEPGGVAVKHYPAWQEFLPLKTSPAINNFKVDIYEQKKALQKQKDKRKEEIDRQIKNLFGTP